MHNKVLVRPRLRLLLNMLDETQKSYCLHKIVLGSPTRGYNGTMFESFDKADAIHSGENGEREEDDTKSSKSTAVKRPS